MYILKQFFAIVIYKWLLLLNNPPNEYLSWINYYNFIFKKLYYFVRLIGNSFQFIITNSIIHSDLLYITSSRKVKEHFSKFLQEKIISDAFENWWSYPSRFSRKYPFGEIKGREKSENNLMSLLHSFWNCQFLTIVKKCK